MEFYASFGEAATFKHHVALLPVSGFTLRCKSVHLYLRKPGGLFEGRFVLSGGVLGTPQQNMDGLRGYSGNRYRDDQPACPQP